MNDDRAREVVDHLQGAMRELIAAGQAFLAAFEDVVERPDTGPNLLAALETAARRFVPSEADDTGGDDDNDGDDGGDGFEPIRID